MAGGITLMGWMQIRGIRSSGRDHQWRRHRGRRATESLIDVSNVDATAAAMSIKPTGSSTATTAGARLRCGAVRSLSTMALVKTRTAGVMIYAHDRGEAPCRCCHFESCFLRGFSSVPAAPQHCPRLPGAWRREHLRHLSCTSVHVHDTRVHECNTLAQHAWCARGEVGQL